MAEDNEDAGVPGTSNLEFWRAFEDYLTRADHPVAPTAVREDRMERGLGRDGFLLQAIYFPAVPMGGEAAGELQVALVIDHPRARTLFAVLHAQRHSIEAELEHPLVWNCVAEVTPCRIYVARQADLSQREDWPWWQAWMSRELNRFDHVFAPRVQRIFLDGVAA